MSDFYARLIGLPRDEVLFPRIRFCAFVGDVVLYRRGVTTELELKTYWSLDAAQWADVLLLFGKILAKPNSNKFLHDGAWVLHTAEENRQRSARLGIPMRLEFATWTGFLATVDVLAASGSYN